jgi:hypothetical protein
MASPLNITTVHVYASPAFKPQPIVGNMDLLIDLIWQPFISIVFLLLLHRRQSCVFHSNNQEVCCCCCCCCCCLTKQPTQVEQAAAAEGSTVARLYNANIRNRVEPNVRK